MYVIFTLGHEYRGIARKYQLFVTQKNQFVLMYAPLEPLVWALFFFTNMAIEHHHLKMYFLFKNGDFAILSIGAGFLPSI